MACHYNSGEIICFFREKDKKTFVNLKLYRRGVIEAVKSGPYLREVEAN
jgi:hypothetical protein